MAEEEEKTEGEEEEGKSGSNKTLIIILIALVLLIGIGVATFLVLGSSGEGEDGAEEEITLDEEELIELPGAVLPLETFIVNLQVKGSFLKVTIQLEFEQPELPPTIEADIPKVRDTVIRTLSSKTAAQILSAEGKEELSQELVEAINETLGAEDIISLYFTEFIVQ